MQGNNARRVGNPPITHGLQGIFKVPGRDANIFCLLYQPMQATRLATVTTPQIQMHVFGTAARRWKVVEHRPQRSELKPSFLLRFAVSNFFW
ncbi:hypothetical protein D3C78_1111750 [compost metagenome]